MKIINMLESSYPKNLKRIKNPPTKLYAEGDTELLNKNSLAIVGTRKPTEYGKRLLLILQKGYLAKESA